MKWIFFGRYDQHAALNRVAAGLRACLALTAAACASTAFAADAPASQPYQAEVQGAVEQVRAAHNLPAMGAALISSDGVKALAVSGQRKRGENIAASTEDLWHLGSDGKAMTATMIARLVERGTMKWSQTLGDTFPDLAPSMSDDMKGITLTQLLSHQSGLDANFELRRYVGRADLTAARIDTVKEAITKGLRQRPGSGFFYSNWGYTIASAMAERASGKSFESLMRDEVFAPLGIKSAGFGGTGTPGKIDQPWPHTSDGKPAPANGPDMDNVPTMAAAGTMHMSLADWARFVSEHLRGAQGKSNYLKRETFTTLHTAVGADYALGWLTPARSWAGGRTLHHAGDNTMNFALVWAAPLRDVAVLVVTNQSGAGRAADELTGAVLKAWLAGEKSSPAK